MTPFDRSRFDWYPPGYGGPAVVQGSTGAPRPPLATPLDVFLVHYGGAGRDWLDPGDTAAELRAIELYARGAGKPNEYNSCSDSESVTWEYAGPFLAAHAGPFNSTDWGHLTVLGLDQLDEPTAQRLIAGIRRARRQAVAAGYLTPDHVVSPHSARRSTTCPGPLHLNARWWAQIIAPLTESTSDMDIYILTPPNPAAEPSSPWVYIAGASMRPAFGRDTEARPGYTVPPIVNCPANRVHEYRNAVKSLGL